MHAFIQQLFANYLFNNWGFSGCATDEEPPPFPPPPTINARDIRDSGSIPGPGGSLGQGHGN